MTVPMLYDPVGDPAGVRVGSRRLVGAAESVGVVARGLSDLNQQAVQAWESTAQRVFSIVADIMSQVIGGAAAVTTDMAGALDRYANVLEGSQNDVRVCRQRLQSLVASTPVGMVPDQVAVNAIVGQANEAYARAGQAARELSATTLNLMGNPTANGSLPASGDANASFISRAHNGGLASTHPAAAAFDAQAAHIQTQMNGVMTALTGLAGTESRPNPDPGLYPSSTTLGGNSAGFSVGEALGPGMSVMESLGLGASVIGGNATPGFVMDGGAYVAPGQVVVGGSWSPAPNRLYLTPPFPSDVHPSVTQPLGMPRRLPLLHPIIQSMIPGTYSDAMNQLAKSKLAERAAVFNTPYDPYTRDGRP